MPLTERTRVDAREIVARYPQSRSALLPMLHLVQAEEGYVSARGVALCAEELGLTTAEVAAVATFYTMYKREPVGEHLVSVCTNLSCQVLGGDEIYAAVSRHLGVGHDQTTRADDGSVPLTLEHAECLAACDYAPVVTVDYEFFDDQTTESTLELVQRLQRGEKPRPTRGAPLCSFREISRQLAGFPDEDHSDALARRREDAGVDAGEPRAGSGATAPPVGSGATAPPVGSGATAPPVGSGADPGTTPAHPTPPAPTDSRGTADLDGTDVGVRAREVGVAGGVTERVLDDAEAAATYTDEPDRARPGPRARSPASPTAGRPPSRTPPARAATRRPTWPGSRPTPRRAERCRRPPCSPGASTSRRAGPSRPTSAPTAGRRCAQRCAPTRTS